MINKYKNYIHKNKKAFSLVELLLAITLFSSVIIVIGTMVFDSYRNIKSNEIKNKAIYQIKETVNAISVLKNDLWTNILNNADGLPRYLEFDNVNGTYYIVAGEQIIDEYILSFVINDVYRDIDGNITYEGGYLDAHTKKILITANWNDVIGKEQIIETEYFVNDWNTKELVVSTYDEFLSGSFDLTYAKNDVDGEVKMESVFYADWCKPELQLNTYDIPGNAYAKSIFGLPGKAYLGTSGNASGTAFTDVTITGIDDPEVAIRGEWNRYVADDIFVLGNYAYVATRNPVNEVAIIDLSVLPLTQVGVFNAPGTYRAKSVYVKDNIGYLAAGSYIYSFDLSSKTGSRSLIGSLKVALNPNWGTDGYVSKIVANGNYLYVALVEDWYELVIVNITNPASMSIISQTSINNQQTGDFQVRSDGTRVYFATDSSDTDTEFHIIDTTVKSGPRNIISSYDTNGMSINGLSIVELDNRAILVGDGGQEYQVINLSNESSLLSCGGMEFNTGIYDVASVIDNDGNSFTYLVANDSVRDFQVIRGGPGGRGGDDGYGYADLGSYESDVYDTGTNTVYYYYLTFDHLIPLNTDLKIQVRTGNTPDLSSESYRGPDGTTSTYFSSIGITSFNSYFHNKRYIQFKAYFSSDSISSAELELVRINYQE